MRVATDYLWLPACVLAFLAGFLFVSLASGQTPTAAPYAFTGDGKLEPTADQKPGTIAALMHEKMTDSGRPYTGWTSPTTRGFNVPGMCIRKLVYRDGPRGAPTYVAPIDASCNGLLAPTPYAMGIPWSDLGPVAHEDIEP